MSLWMNLSETQEGEDNMNLAGLMLSEEDGIDGEVTDLESDEEEKREDDDEMKILGSRP